MNTESNKALVAGALMLLVGLGGGWMLSQRLSGGSHGADAAASTAAPAGERDHVNAIEQRRARQRPS